MNVGRYLNTPERQMPCPRCGGTDCRMSVYVRAAVWDCGHIETLPPLHVKRAHREHCEECR